MSGEQTPGVVVTERANAGSALARLMSPILAVVAQLLLLDAAVETFWSGSARGAAHRGDRELPVHDL